MIKQLNINRCKTFIALLLVLCNFLSIFGMGISFKTDNALAVGAGTYLTVHKVDEDGNYVEGAVLQLLDPDGNVFEEWTTTNEGHEILLDVFPPSGLDNYVLHEVSAPNGYELAVDIVIVEADLEEDADSENYWPDADWYAYKIYMVDPKKTNIENPEDSNDDFNTDLSTEFERVDKGENIIVTFENEMETHQSLTVSKVVRQEKMVETNRDFEFTVNFSNLPANETFGEIVADSDGKATKTFTLKNRESLEFTGLPVGTQYEVVETEVSNYTPSYLVTGLSVVKNSNSDTWKTEIETLESNEKGSVIFTNVLNYGKLVVEKVVEGNAPADAEFEFTITLTGDKISGTQTFGGVTFTDGVGTFTLKNGESKEFDLPAGTEYKVEEKEYREYETSYEMQVVDPYAVMPTAQLYDYLIIDKIDEDGNHLDGAHLALIDDTGNIAMEWNTSDYEYGYEIDVTEYSARDNMVMEDYYGWTLREIQAPDGYKIADDIIISENCFTSIEEGLNGGNDYIIKMVDERIDIVESETPVGIEGAIIASKYSVVTVTNTYTSVNVTLKKTVTNPEVMDENQKFTINGTFENLEPNKSYKVSNGDTITADENGNATYIAELAHNEEVVIYDIPVGATYKFTEVAGEYKASFNIIDRNKS